MSELVVRRLLIDLDAPVPRHWFGGDAFRTAIFNALSMSFPFGEQFFMDSVRNGLKALPPALQEKFASEAQGFIGQEATHRRIHALFNGQIEKHGLVNHWEARARERLKIVADFHPRHWLAITAATEHFTAVFADWLLSNPELFEGSEERFKTMWLWHSAEESEHKCTAFDLYLALGGSHQWRLTWFRRISLVFFTDLLRQTVNNLYHDGTLWQWRTWVSAAGFLFGKRGLISCMFKPLRAYTQEGFHPRQLHNTLSVDWLNANQTSFVEMGNRTAPA
ncbi:MAG: metal-dependent hydrolase [Betaproteobacteria bacterium]|nr:metal-dependent hydrolase [Betaproteobacteria bacterium]NDE40942.1 metal-dependent hydrolase [Betaproteobacteria bacterium]NDE72783.1 metal-dependent hydrolase [Betaproteobacteria bacterium]